jgi:hypothetical protein
MKYQPLWGTCFIPRLPRPVRHQLYRRNQDHADQAQASMQALELLGTNAVSAIPELAALAMQTNILDRDIARKRGHEKDNMGWSGAGKPSTPDPANPQKSQGWVAACRRPDESD